MASHGFHDVPLVRPSFPDPAAWVPKWQASTRASGQFSNFGPLWMAAADRLSEVTNMIALPCATGTDAIALAILAHRLQHGERWLAVEAFTFEATVIAAERIVGDRFELVRTDDMPERHPGIASVVRTRHFGCGRQFPDNTAIIDAAGGFGPTKGFIPPGLSIPIAVSFHATKNFPIGEGGAVFLPIGWDDTAKRLVQAMNFGFDEWRYRHHKVQYATNAKLDELRCAVLLAQLDRAEYFAARSARIRQQTIWLTTNAPVKAPAILGAWQSLLVVEAPDPDMAQKVVGALEREAITARRVYWPSGYSELFSRTERSLVALPSDATEEELQQIADVMCDVIRG